MVGSQWAQHAEKLTDWVFRTRINRTDAFGRYTRLGIRGKPGRDGKPIGNNYTANSELIREIVLRHFRGAVAHNVIGLLSISLENTCRWIEIDIDAHGPITPELAELNRTYALLKFYELCRVGLDPLLWDSNGKGGFHLVVIFSMPIPSELAYRFGKWLVRDWREAGLPVEPESFPKRKDRNTRKGQGGGWVRLPGRHHTRDIWAAVFDGERGEWASGGSAAQLICGHLGVDPDRMPPEVRCFETEDEKVQRLAKERRAVHRHDSSVRVGAGSLARGRRGDRLEIARIVAELYPPAISGRRGHDRTFRLACLLVLGCDLTIDEALPIMQAWSATCSPPWTNGDVRHKLEGADSKPDDRGYLLYDTAEPVPVVFQPQDDRPVKSLDEIRAELLQTRLESIGVPGGNLDSSGTGHGKTFADVLVAAEVVRRGGRALFLLPTHENCREIEAELVRQGVEAASYPARIDEQDANRRNSVANCWNERANEAQAMGLNVITAVCRAGCRHKEKCEQVGYLAGLMRASDAPVALATHTRGAVQGICDLGSGRSYVAVHEDSIGLLSPCDEVGIEHIKVAATMLNGMLNDPHQLDRLADHEDQYDFLRHLANVTDEIVKKCEMAETTVALPRLPRWVNRDGSLGIPNWLEARIFRYAVSHHVRTRAWRILLAYAVGELRAVYLVVHPTLQQSTGGHKTVERSVFVTWPNPIPEQATTWLSDATADLETVNKLAGQPVVDRTPDCRAPIKFKAVQIPIDITRRTDQPNKNVKRQRKKVHQMLRGVLADHQHSQRIGVICHRPHVSLIEEFVATDSRVAKLTYFGAGDERSSNAWKNECDLIVVLGTPRPGPDAVRRQLLIFGDIEAASILDPVWERYQWIGRTETGAEFPVKSMRYADPRWQKAFQSLCRAELQQCYGRGRGVCDDGVEVVVVSTEECGLPICDKASGAMNATEARVFQAVIRESHASAKKELLGNTLDSTPTPVRTGRIAMTVGITAGTARTYLNSLKRRGLVVNRGKTGWLPVASRDGQSHGSRRCA